MAKFTIQFFSQALSRGVTFQAVVPSDSPVFLTAKNPNYQRPMKLLILLHGYNGSDTDWLYGSDIANLATMYNVAVALPAGENSFYVDCEASGAKYATFVGQEIPAFMRKTFGISDRKEDTFIGGFSMGGFGALHVGMKFPETFSKIMALSSALIVQGLTKMGGRSNAMANTAYYERVFGDFEKAEASDMNYEVRVRAMKANGEPIPGIFMACGSEDFLVNPNNQLDAFLTAEGVAHQYFVSPGQHNWTFWNQYLEPALKWMVEE